MSEIKEYSFDSMFNEDGSTKKYTCNKCNKNNLELLNQSFAFICPNCSSQNLIEIICPNCNNKFNSEEPNPTCDSCKSKIVIVSKPRTIRLVNKRIKKRKNIIGFCVTFFISLPIFIFIFYIMGSEDIVGESSDSYLIMDSKCGCTSPNGDEKKEDIFEKEYDNKWVQYAGEITLIEDDVLSLRCDPNSIASDVAIEFDNPKTIYDLSIGQVVAVRFVLRTQGGCFLSYEGDNGEILTTDFDEALEYYH